MSYKIVKNNDVLKINKSSVDMSIYGKINDNISIVMQSVEKGHFEEFVHDQSTFTYLFLEGKSTFVLDDEKVEVSAGDMLIINPGTRIYYYGSTKQLLIVSPAYDEKYERHIRYIDEKNL